MNLLFDIGNTTAKIAVMNGDEIICQWREKELSRELIDEIIGRYAPQKAIVASTRGNASDVCRMVEGRVEYLLQMTSQTPVPIEIDYKTPETLGVDRIAAAVGAVERYGCGSMLIVDFGTAITFDKVDNGVFCGGNISLGVGARFEALHAMTSALPKCSPKEPTEGFGRSTIEAIEEGVMQGVLYEIKGYIEEFFEEKGEKRVIFCGDDAKYFANRIKNAIFASYNMTLVGLNRILEYNAKREKI